MGVWLESVHAARVKVSRARYVTQHSTRPSAATVYPRAWGAKTVRREHLLEATLINCLAPLQTYALLGIEVLNLLALLQCALVATKTRLGELVGPLLCASTSRLSREK